MVNKEHAQSTIRRLQMAVSREDMETVKNIVEALDEAQAKYLLIAMSISLFEVP